MRYVVGLAAVIGMMAFSTTDTFRRWKDPHAYWLNEVKMQKEGVDYYQREVEQCTAAYRKLEEEQSKHIWIAQKKLEGLGDLEALEDYEIAVDVERTSCSVFIDILNATKVDLENAKTRLGTLR